MLRIAIKLFALYLVFVLVIRPLWSSTMRFTAAKSLWIEKTFWWMSPGANGW